MQRMEDNLNVKALQFQILYDSTKEIIKRSCKKLQYVPQSFCMFVCYMLRTTRFWKGFITSLPSVRHLLSQATTSVCEKEASMACHRQHRHLNHRTLYLPHIVPESKIKTLRWLSFRVH